MPSDRQKLILQIIIEEYIRTAQAVSSKYLHETYDLGLSPATIRAEMKMLEDEGYLQHLHTSGGRVPTDKAYRYYVDTLEVGNLQLSNRYKSKIHEAIKQAQGDPRSLNRIMAHVLSQMTGSVVITNIVGSKDYYKSGLSALFGMPEFHEAQRMARLASFFDEFDQLFDRLHQHVMADHNQLVRVLIGREHPFNRVNEESIIQSEYKLPDRSKGSLTVIGPTRMDYERNLSLVRYVVEELNRKYE